VNKLLNGLKADYFKHTGRHYEYCRLDGMPPHMSDGTAPTFSRIEKHSVDWQSTSVVFTGLSDTFKYDFSVRFTGYVIIPTAGVYGFATDSDDGSKVCAS